ncbi:hypothetical protein [Ligaoa zhengdingensis]|uniref:hypothetical protein n=1 Tax=Ligaoa zhengdingensis TaxID=2763658 RepID=UPI00206C3EE9|nr:MAG TPA: Head Tail Connector Protein [Caudoviricetes sp.]
MYASAADYRSIFPDGGIPDSKLISELQAAECDIDSLTYGRIVRAGFDNLSAFRQKIIKRAVCEQARFRYDNAEMLDGFLSAYSINGVSVSFDRGCAVQYGGVATLPRIYALLRQTGFTYRGVR